MVHHGSSRSTMFNFVWVDLDQLYLCNYSTDRSISAFVAKVFNRVHDASFIEITQGLGFVFCLHALRVYSPLYGIMKRYGLCGHIRWARLIRWWRRLWCHIPIHYLVGRIHKSDRKHISVLFSSFLCQHLLITLQQIVAPFPVSVPTLLLMPIVGLWLNSKS